MIKQTADVVVNEVDSGVGPTPKPICILVLQGGGAMGAYHVGAYQALREAAFDPDWVCGISMGAINGAIIAGNAPEARLEKLDAFWETISRPSVLPEFGGTRMRRWDHRFSYAMALTLGQPGFFTPRPVDPYFAAPGLAATSFYDTDALLETLVGAVDFDRLNDGKTRLSVGATDVETGKLIFFDTQRMAGRFSPAHVVASGSLPPGFPPTPIDGKFYWDGGCVSNSPLEAVRDDTPAGHAVVFVIDLWSASGPAPNTMMAADWRAKQIRYASNTPTHVDALATKVNLRRALHLLEASTDKPSPQRLDIVHIVYHPDEDQIPASDAEFSRTSIAARRAAGLADMRRALAEQPWHRLSNAPHLGCMVHRVNAGSVDTLVA
jgi:NTE family protein